MACPGAVLGRLLEWRGMPGFAFRYAVAGPKPDLSKSVPTQCNSTKGGTHIIRLRLNGKCPTFTELVCLSHRQRQDRMGTRHRTANNGKESSEHCEGLSRLKVSVVDVEPVAPVFDAQAADLRLRV